MWLALDHKCGAAALAITVAQRSAEDAFRHGKKLREDKMLQDNCVDTTGRTRRLTKFVSGSCAGIAAASLVMAIPLSPAQAQAPGSKDMLYATSTVAKGSCPGMDWHIVVHADKSVNGMVGWDQAKHMVHLIGTMDDQGAIKMKAVDSGSNMADIVTGTINGSVLKASISGTGTPCDNQAMDVPRIQGSPAQG
jgi:hypothetical protein